MGALRKQCNITLDKTELSRSEIPRRHRRYNKIWFTYHGAVPILVCDILRIVQSLNLKAMGDHTFLENIVVTGECGSYTQLELWSGS